MKINFSHKLFGGVLAVLFCAAVELQAQQRFGGGGGGGGFGGFGGFGGGFARAGGGTGGASGSGQYNNNGTVGSAVISVDPVTHNIIVIADKETTEQIGKVIASLDEPIAQVLIKVVFLEVQRNDSSEIGVQGTYTGGALSKNLAQITGYLTNYTVVNQGTPSVGLVPSTITPLYNNSAGNSLGLPTTLPGALGNGGVYQVIGSDFTATLQAVAQAGRAEVLARPSILARDGQLAKIVIGQEIYLPNSVTPGTTSATLGVSATTINGTYTEVGIILNVTPYIGANDLVQMILQPQTSSLDTSSQGQEIASGGILSSPIFAPNINLRSADTVVVTPDAQTVVIGGLISNNRSTADTKVPFLGDIPLLGQLFKSSAKVEGKTELMMFLTPHIVHAPAQLTGVSSAEMNKSMLISNSISEKLLDQYLERIPAKKKK